MPISTGPITCVTRSSRMNDVPQTKQQKMKARWATAGREGQRWEVNVGGPASSKRVGDQPPTASRRGSVANVCAACCRPPILAGHPGKGQGRLAEILLSHLGLPAPKLPHAHSESQYAALSGLSGSMISQRRTRCRLVAAKWQRASRKQSYPNPSFLFLFNCFHHQSSINSCGRTRNRAASFRTCSTVSDRSPLRIFDPMLA